MAHLRQLPSSPLVDSAIPSSKEKCAAERERIARLERDKLAVVYVDLTFIPPINLGVYTIGEEEEYRKAIERKNAEEKVLKETIKISPNIELMDLSPLDVNQIPRQDFKRSPIMVTRYLEEVVLSNTPSVNVRTFLDFFSTGLHSEILSREKMSIITGTRGSGKSTTMRYCSTIISEKKEGPVAIYLSAFDLLKEQKELTLLADRLKKSTDSSLTATLQSEVKAQCKMLVNNWENIIAATTKLIGDEAKIDLISLVEGESSFILFMDDIDLLPEEIRLLFFDVWHHFINENPRIKHAVISMADHRLISIRDSHPDLLATIPVFYLNLLNTLQQKNYLTSLFEALPSIYQAQSVEDFKKVRDSKEPKTNPGTPLDDTLEEINALFTDLKLQTSPLMLSIAFLTNFDRTRRTCNANIIANLMVGLIATKIKNLEVKKDMLDMLQIIAILAFIYPYKEREAEERNQTLDIKFLENILQNLITVSSYFRGLIKSIFPNLEITTGCDLLHSLETLTELFMLKPSGRLDFFSSSFLFLLVYQFMKGKPDIGKKIVASKPYEAIASVLEASDLTRLDFQRAGHSFDEYWIPVFQYKASYEGFYPLLDDLVTSDIFTGKKTLTQKIKNFYPDIFYSAIASISDSPFSLPLIDANERVKREKEVTVAFPAGAMIVSLCNGGVPFTNDKKIGVRYKTFRDAKPETSQPANLIPTGPIGVLVVNLPPDTEYNTLTGMEKINFLCTRIHHLYQILNAVFNKRDKRGWLIVWKEYGIVEKTSRFLSSDALTHFKNTFQKMTRENSRLAILAGTVASSWEEKSSIKISNAAYLFQGNDFQIHHKTQPWHETQGEPTLAKAIFYTGDEKTRNPIMMLKNFSDETKEGFPIGVEICYEHKLGTLRREAKSKPLFHFILSDSVNLSKFNEYGQIVMQCDSILESKPVYRGGDYEFNYAEDKDKGIEENFLILQHTVSDISNILSPDQVDIAQLFSKHFNPLKIAEESPRPRRPSSSSSSKTPSSTSSSSTFYSSSNSATSSTSAHSTSSSSRSFMRRRN